MTNKQKQHLLAFLGFDPGPIDGVMGSQSRKATKAFQEAYELDPDGIFGKATEARIREVIGAAEEPETDPEPTWWAEIENFTRGEFACPCPRCGGFPVEPQEKVVRLLQRTRSHFGKKCYISSGVRCQAHNDELPGSAKNSYHLKGSAVDFCIEGIPSSMVLTYVKTLPGVRYAYRIDSLFVHMDTGIGSQVQNTG